MPTKTNSVTMLVILDGFGWREEKKYNAIAQANTPTFDNLMREYPHAIIKASGKAVGLPEGYIGNSEVGHLTIGAGRIIPSPMEIMTEAIKDGSFFSNQALCDLLSCVKKNKSALHIVGMLSDAGVHADTDHMIAFMKAAHEHGITNIVIDAFLDGRDFSPRSAAQFLKPISEKIKEYGATLGSITGRFYAMDRNKNWKRTEATYEILTSPQETPFSDWQQMLNHYYEKDITDEFIPPTQFNSNTVVKDGDGIIFTNFRPDRIRQLAESFSEPDFAAFPAKKLKLCGVITPFSYEKDLHAQIMFHESKIDNTLMHVLSENGKTTFAIAETEKYAHVTYFFNGGKETPEKNETQLMITTQDDKTKERSPEMAADKITYAVIESLQTNPCDFYLINYANADIIGHSGNLEKTIKAVECLDRQISKLYEQVVEKMNGTLYITADHGNAEYMWDEKTNQPWTAHTTNPVPFLWINKHEQGKKMQLPIQQLRDIAPFILKHMGLRVPKEME